MVCSFLLVVRCVCVRRRRDNYLFGCFLKVVPYVFNMCQEMYGMKITKMQARSKKQPCEHATT